MNQENNNLDDTKDIETLLQSTAKGIKAPRSLMSILFSNPPVTNHEPSRLLNTNPGRGSILNIKTLIKSMSQNFKVYVPALLIAVALIAGGSYYATNRGQVSSTGNQVNSSKENIEQEQEQIPPQAIPVENTVKDIQASLDIEDSLAEDSSSDFAAARGQDEDVLNHFESEVDDDFKF